MIENSITRYHGITLVFNKTGSKGFTGVVQLCHEQARKKHHCTQNIHILHNIWHEYKDHLLRESNKYRSYKLLLANALATTHTALSTVQPVTK